MIMVVDGFLFNWLIMIYLFVCELVCLYIWYVVINLWKRWLGGKLCVVKFVILYILCYVCCNFFCCMVYKVVLMI